MPQRGHIRGMSDAAVRNGERGSKWGLKGINLGVRPPRLSLVNATGPDGPKIKKTPAK